MSCVAIACAAFRFATAKDGYFVFGVLGAVTAPVAFLSAWLSFARRQRSRRIAASGIVATSLLFVSLFPAAATKLLEAARRDSCTSKLGQIGLAIQNYRLRNGHFPPAYIADRYGSPLLSWRLLILPYMDSDMTLYSAFNLSESWDGPNTFSRSQTPVGIYRCPNEGMPAPAITNFVAIVGPNAAWPGATGRNLADFKDPSKTILVIEVTNWGINWAEPRDLRIDEIAVGANQKTGLPIASNHIGGFNALFADGHVEFIPDDIDPKKLAEMFEINPQSGASD